MRIGSGELRDALKATGCAVSARPTEPHLAAVRVLACDDSVTFSTTDLKTWVSSKCTAQGGDRLDVLVSHKTLASIAKVVRSSVVELAVVDGTVLRIVGGTSEWSAPLILAEPMQGPALPAQVGSMDAEVLQRMVKVTAPAASREALVACHPVQVHARDGLLQLSATDRYRMHLTREPFKASSSGGDAVAMPHAAALARLVEPLRGEVRMYADPESGLFGLEDDSTRVLTRMIDTQGPDIAAFLRDNLEGRTKATTVVDAAELEAALRSVQPAVGASVGVHLTITAGSLKVTAKTDDAQALALVEGYIHDGRGIVVYLNASYLADALSALDSARVQMQWIDPKKPMLLTAEDSSTQCVIMVIRSDDAGWVAVERSTAGGA